MNRRQKAVLTNFVVVVSITVIAIVAMIHFKDWVNHSEVMRAVEHLGQEVLRYRKEYGMVPAESFVDEIRPRLTGRARLGDLHYRARWIDFDATADEILAYTERNYRTFFLHDGFIVLRLDGRVEWMDKIKFKAILAEQQSQAEIDLTRK